MRINVVLGGFLLFGFLASSIAHPFLNSAEPQCDGTDPTVLMCDDFEDGSWFVTDCDNGGSADPNNDGWCGTIYATDPLNQNFARCSGKGAAGTDCTATTGYRDTSQGVYGGQGFHTLGPSSPINRGEIYHREYLLFVDPYTFGHEKWTFYQGDGNYVGTQHGLIQTPFGTDMFDWAQQNGTGCPGDYRCPQNQGNDLHMIPGHWYAMETHIDLNNGIVEFWQNDCGTSGLECVRGDETLRLRYTGMSWSTVADGCCDYHQENWCPLPGGAGSCTGEVYRDQVVWATRRIGWMELPGAGDNMAPAAPTSLVVL